jgi:ABC-type nitrate/sulfonate/bicarbonate transport system substrate-binding protein
MLGKRAALRSVITLTATTLAGFVPASPAGLASAETQPAPVQSARCAANRAAGTITYLTGFGWQASVGILDPIAAQAQGFYSQLCLKVLLKPGTGDPTSTSQLVAAGRATISELGSASDAIQAAAGGIPVEAVATYGNTAANTLLTMTSVTNLRQLDGKTIGYKGAMPPIITAMLEKAGVNMKSLKEVSVGYDPTILPRGQVQGLTAYKSNEPVQLRDEGYKIHEWDPDAFGLHGTFNVLDVNRSWAKAHPRSLEDFLRATFHAFYWCRSHVTTCIHDAAHYQAGYNLNQNAQRWQLESGEVMATLLPGHGVGFEDRAQWQPEYRLLLADHLITHPVDLASIIAPAYVDAIYRGRALLWPGT